MNSETWQQLFALETSDAVRTWHQSIFHRELGARRVSEITSAAKQAREFFRNAAQANNSVRSLLSFYGVASLSRAALLVLKPGTGEAALVGGHGLATVDWKSTLSGEISKGLTSLESLEIQTTEGLFIDFLRQTKNHVCMHVHSSAVDWGISYDLPEIKAKVSLGDLMSRLPDIHRYLPGGRLAKSVRVNNISFTESEGFLAQVDTQPFLPIARSYADSGYELIDTGSTTELRATTAVFNTHTAQFTHTFVNKMFGEIPTLYIAAPFDDGTRYSQLAQTYMLSYFLGMLTRYFPTQWIALSNGTKGDGIWPAVNAAQKYIESSFPELILEYIQSRVAGAPSDMT